jgi:hypothetical protein
MSVQPSESNGKREPNNMEFLWAARNLDLSQFGKAAPTTKLAAYTLASFMGMKGYSSASRMQIAKAMEVSERTADRALERLVAIGVVKKVPGGGKGRSSRYFDNLLNGVTVMTPFESQTVSPGKVQTVSSGSQTVSSEDPNSVTWVPNSVTAMTRIEDQGLEDQNLEDHTLELGARSENDQVCVDPHKKMSKGKDKGESMSMMRNFDAEDHTPSVPSQDQKMSMRAPTPSEPIQDKKMSTKDQLPSQDEGTISEKRIREWVGMLDLTTQTSDNLINEAMKLRMHQDISLFIIKEALDLWEEAVWSDGKRPGPQHLHKYVDEVKAKSNRKQTSFVGPNASFEDQEYETFKEYYARQNAAG